MKLYRASAVALAVLMAASLLGGCGRRGVEADSSAEESSLVEEGPGEYVRGVWEDGIYTNDYLALSLELPTGWVAATEEEMMNSMELGSVYLSDEQKAQAELSKLTTVYDTTITNLAAQSSLSLMAENLTMSLGGTSLDAEGYAELMAAQLEATGLPYQIGELSYREIAGEEYAWLPADVQNTATTQWLFFRRAEDYMISLTVSFSTGGDADIDALLDSISAL